jgi:TRAP-type C4-dicarboxylate transport system permease small subunit
MQTFNRCLNFLRDGFGEISSWLVLVVTVFITLDVALRYFFKASIPAGMELTQVMLAVLVFFSFGKAQQGKIHVRVEFLIEKLSSKTRNYWEIVVHFLALIFFAVIFGGAIGFFIDSYEMKEYFPGVIPVPIYPARGAIVIGSGLMIIELLRDLISLLRGKGKEVIVPGVEQREIEESIAKIEEEEKRKGKK